MNYFIFCLYDNTTDVPRGLCFTKIKAKTYQEAKDYLKKHKKRDLQWCLIYTSNNKWKGQILADVFVSHIVELDNDKINEVMEVI